MHLPSPIPNKYFVLSRSIWELYFTCAHKKGWELNLTARAAEKEQKYIVYCMRHKWPFKNSSSIKIVSRFSLTYHARSALIRAGPKSYVYARRASMFGTIEATHRPSQIRVYIAYSLYPLYCGSAKDIRGIFLKGCHGRLKRLESCCRREALCQKNEETKKKLSLVVRFFLLFLYSPFSWKSRARRRESRAKYQRRLGADVSSARRISRKTRRGGVRRWKKALIRGEGGVKKAGARVGGKIRGCRAPRPMLGLQTHFRPPRDYSDAAAWRFLSRGQGCKKGQRKYIALSLAPAAAAAAPILYFVVVDSYSVLYILASI